MIDRLTRVNVTARNSMLLDDHLETEEPNPALSYGVAIAWICIMRYLRLLSWWSGNSYYSSSCTCLIAVTLLLMVTVKGYCWSTIISSQLRLRTIFAFTYWWWIFYFLARFFAGIGGSVSRVSYSSSKERFCVVDRFIVWFCTGELTWMSWLVSPNVGLLTVLWVMEVLVDDMAVIVWCAMSAVGEAYGCVDIATAVASWLDAAMRLDDCVDVWLSDRISWARVLSVEWLNGLVMLLVSLFGCASDDAIDEALLTVSDLPPDSARLLSLCCSSLTWASCIKSANSWCNKCASSASLYKPKYRSQLSLISRRLEFLLVWTICLTIVESVLNSKNSLLSFASLVSFVHALIIACWVISFHRGAVHLRLSMIKASVRSVGLSAITRRRIWRHGRPMLNVRPQEHVWVATSRVICPWLRDDVTYALGLIGVKPSVCCSLANFSCETTWRAA